MAIENHSQYLILLFKKFKTLEIVLVVSIS